MSDVITLANEIVKEKERIRQAINNRGVNLPASAPFSEYASKIPLIEAQVSEGDYYWKGTPYDNTQTSYTIPGNYDAIDDYAFTSETNLQSINLNNVRYVGNNTFSGCSSLTNFVADHVFKFGDNVLSGCTSLTSFDNVSAKVIGDNFLCGCPVTTIRLGAERIGANINPNNSELTSIDLTGVKSIGSGAFYNCDHLNTIVAPDLEKIGDSAFVNMNNWNYSFDQSTFSLSFPKLKNIGIYAFYYSNGLKSIDMPNVEKIGGYAFYGVKELESINMPKVEKIEEYAFDYTGNDNSRITDVNIPNCKYIGNCAFYYTYTSGTNTTERILNNLTIADGCELHGTCFYSAPKNVIGKIGAIHLDYSGNNMRFDQVNDYNIDFSGLHTITCKYTSGHSYVFTGNSSSHGLCFNGTIDLKNLINIVQNSTSYELRIFEYINYSRYRISKVWINKDLIISNPSKTYLLNSLSSSTHIYTDADAKQSSWTNVGGSGTWHFSCSHQDFEDGTFNQ